LRDPILSSIVEEIYVALNNGLRVLTAIGIRTAIDRASEMLGVDQAENFGEKLTQLFALGKIGAGEMATLETLVDAGGAAAHRGWEPSLAELDTMMSMMESFLHRSFFLGKAAEKLRAAIPARPRRQDTSRRSS
jgi:hypothetical protein